MNKGSRWGKNKGYFRKLLGLITTFPLDGGIMYYYLVDVPIDKDIGCRWIEAIEPELCRMLAFERALWEGKAKVLCVLGNMEEAEGAEEEVRKLEQEREKNLRARPT